MSLRLEMLQVARLSPKMLGDSTELVKTFCLSRMNEDGGFRGRDEESDLYYTSFAVDALVALQADLPRFQIQRYLESFHDGKDLDLVHLCCLIRLWSLFSEKERKVPLALLFDRLEGFRAKDGGYDPQKTNECGTTYANFLAYGVYADHGRVPKNSLALYGSLKKLRNEDGSWRNDINHRVGSAPATAAAIAILKNDGVKFSLQTRDWLLGNFYERGGFLPFSKAPMPDLLSTSVTLHALHGLQTPLKYLKESCLDYVDSLWSNEGGFHGHWADDRVDVEYTYYGLLALGHLAVA